MKTRHSSQLSASGAPNEIVCHDDRTMLIYGPGGFRIVSLPAVRPLYRSHNSWGEIAISVAGLALTGLMGVAMMYGILAGLEWVLDTVSRLIG